MVKTCGDCIHADVCKEVNGGWFSPKNPAYCKLFKNKDVPSKWISVEDRLPEIISTTRAGRNTYRRSARVLCACLQADGKRFVKEGYMEFFNDYPEPNWRIPGTIHSVTHWMPLPEPPKED